MRNNLSDSRFCVVFVTQVAHGSGETRMEKVWGVRDAKFGKQTGEANLATLPGGVRLP